MKSSVSPIQSRRFTRKPLGMNLAKYLHFSEGTPVWSIGINVSKEGLGILSFQEIKVGDKFILSLEGCEIPLSAMWVERDTIRESLFHCGLQSDNQAYNITNLFAYAKLLAPFPLQAGIDIEAMELSQGKDFFMQMEQQKSLKLHEIGLPHLLEKYNIYATTYKSRQYIGLLRNNLSLERLSSLAIDDIADAAMLFEDKGDHLIKVWPLQNSTRTVFVI